MSWLLFIEPLETNVDVHSLREHGDRLCIIMLPPEQVLQMTENVVLQVALLLQDNMKS